MATLPAETIGQLLEPYLSTPTGSALCDQIARYLDLLARWNRRVSLTSVHDPAEVVKRHFGESLFLADRLPQTGTLLDLGSGAGFPGIPIALLRPELQVTLAESQGKKASFLRETASVLKLSCTVWADRVENMPIERQFHIVALRAVDRMDAALKLAKQRVEPGGMLAVLAGKGTPVSLDDDEWSIQEWGVPQSAGWLILANRK